MHVLNAHAQEGNGIVNVAIDVACLQATFGHDVAIVSRCGDFADLLRQYGVRHFVLDQRRDPKRTVAAFFRFRRMTREFRPHVVHAHVVTGLLLALATRFRRTYRVVATVHNAWQRTSWLMRFADRIIAISDAVAGALARSGVPASKVVIVPNGTIGSPRRAGEFAAAVELEHPAIVSVAGLFERKGIADLLAAFEIVARECETAHLYLVGDGPDRAQFERIAAQSRYARRIHFTSFVAQPVGYMEACDVFVLASRSEPFGLVLAEAREAGCAIVASDIDGIPQVLEGGRCGRLVPPRNPAELARAVLEFIGDPAVRAAYEANALTNLAWLGAERMARATLEAYGTRV